MLIDSHCHIPHKKYLIPTEDVIKEAKAAHVEKLVTVGTSLKDNDNVIEAAKNYDRVYCTVGIYPHEDIKTDIRELKKNLTSQIDESKKIVGIGECGIDITKWKNGRSTDAQVELFEMQIELAKEASLPIVVHNRNGSRYVFEVFDKVGTEWLRGVAHCFSSTWEDAERFLDYGFYISFSANITYPSSKALLEVVQKVPENKFVLETDSPYLPPQQHRGEINYPKYVKIVAEKVAQVKQMPLEKIEKLSFENTCRLFSFYAE